MAINLLNLKPQFIKRFKIYLYGETKQVKTTLAPKWMDVISLSNKVITLPKGVMAQDITTWGEMKQVFRELKKKPEVRETFKAIIVDTIDVAADKCKKYICQQNGIEDLGDFRIRKRLDFKERSLMKFPWINSNWDMQYSLLDTTKK